MKADSTGVFWKDWCRWCWPWQQQGSPVCMFPLVATFSWEHSAEQTPRCRAKAKTGVDQMKRIPETRFQGMSGAVGDQSRSVSWEVSRGKSDKRHTSNIFAQGHVCTHKHTGTDVKPQQELHHTPGRSWQNPVSAALPVQVSANKQDSVK